MGDASVVHQHVELSERLARRGHSARDRGVVAEVERRGERLGAAGAELRCELLELEPVARGQREPRSLACERARECEPDPARSPGEENRLALERREFCHGRDDRTPFGQGLRPRAPEELTAAPVD